MNNATPVRPSFASDNVAGASSEIVEAVMQAFARPARPYGADELTSLVERKLEDLFEREVSVFLVPTGTAANSLCLSVMTPPWGTVFCHAESHINTDECGAPEFFTHGAKLVTIPGPSAKLDCDALRAAANAKRGDVHATQPSCVSITQATEVGSVYSVDNIGAIGEVCKAASLRLHMDGSRFANALVTLGCTPAEMTWKAGVDALSLGATKNGAMGVEAVVLFDRTLAGELAFRRKRAGHLLSKMRLFSAQFHAYLANDLWLSNARQANLMAQRMAKGIQPVAGAELAAWPEANIVFCRLSRTLIDGLIQEGYSFYHDRWAPGVVRFVSSFATTSSDVDQLIASLRQLSASGQHDQAGRG
ncbi:low specificity L-threonine aldolase [Brachymonas denitrificans]|uniref:threonine aldolase family protein n=1 Tax=Brachymonas denitrificans TaxID=28220 RepID=UPI002AFE4C75|nr:low specificity L-threonine aldolase [Brachymonas denitrificans]